VTETGASRAAPPEARTTAAPRAGWSGGRIAALVIGVVLVLLALGLLGAGGTALWADRTQRDGGYATTGVHRFSSDGHVLATENVDLGSAGVGWLYAPGLLGKVRIRVTSTSPGSALFVGIGRSADIERYLSGVGRTEITDFFGDKVRAVAGGPARSAPATQGFWAASTSGPGERTLVWKPEKGTWTVAVMNTNGKAGLGVRADLGARFPALPWIGLGLLSAGAISAVGGGLLIAGAVRSKKGGSDAERGGGRGRVPGE
jgi:hypothetical protein